MPRWRRRRLAANRQGPGRDGPDGRLRQALAAALAAEPPGAVGIAVSGGSDSLALLCLAAELAPGTGRRIAAATVDHGLRPEALDEAARVGAICRGLGLSHHILTWDHGPVRGNLMQAARAARYDLLADWARHEGLTSVLVAHTADDQAETFLMELARSAGLDGLTGMRPGWVQGGIRFLRPLLGASRAELRAVLTARGQVWIEDPSNADPRYARVRARRALPELAPLGIDAAGITASMAHLQSAQAALRQITGREAARLSRHVAGMVQIDRQGWSDLPAEIRRRMLLAAMQEVTGAEYAPRAAALGRVIARAVEGGEATLAGCRIRAKGDSLLILREAKAVSGLIARPGALWDGRWQVCGPFAADMEIRALGAAGLTGCRDWRETGLPREALLVTPAIWQGPALVAAPLAGQDAGFSARILPAPGPFALSH
ncbi:tRNA lysidine(34) synthetase TilS [Tabrizicola sp. DMG-N-6]|uniref:tRNA(Ile)-lysidine synthase n=1 Tax=Szabonella alba TaxID=2804194 RepID=A0A8K0Y1B9_9RHOB|nr:tRNA lysidine(34) synthetase TilS [Szabonella alba]